MKEDKQEFIPDDDSSSGDNSRGSSNISDSDDISDSDKQKKKRKSSAVAKKKKEESAVAEKNMKKSSAVAKAPDEDFDHASGKTMDFEKEYEKGGEDQPKFQLLLEIVNLQDQECKSAVSSSMQQKDIKSKLMLVCPTLESYLTGGIQSLVRNFCCLLCCVMSLFYMSYFTQCVFRHVHHGHFTCRHFIIILP